MDEDIYGTRRAIFQPKRIDTLRPVMGSAIGQEVVVRYMWTIEDDHSAYPGQVAYGEVYPDEGGLGLLQGLWVPEEDLVFIENPKV